MMDARGITSPALAISIIPRVARQPEERRVCMRGFHLAVAVQSGLKNH